MDLTAPRVLSENLYAARVRILHCLEHPIDMPEATHLCVWRPWSTAILSLPEELAQAHRRLRLGPGGRVLVTAVQALSKAQVVCDSPVK